MLKYLFVVFILLSFPCNSSDREQHYIGTLASTAQAYEKKGGDSIWPHFQPFNQPVLFHFKNGQAYAFKFYSHSPIWEKQAIKGCRVLFCSRVPIPLAPLHPSFPLENQRAFVFSLDHHEDSSDLPLLTFVHERFHIHQFEFFRKEKIVEAVDADYQSIDQLALMELEHCLLTRYLKAADFNEKIHSLKDFLAVCRLRRKPLAEVTVKWEDHQQKMEGLADYVSVKTYQLFPVIPDFNVANTLLEMRENKAGGSLKQDALKDRHYFVGAVLAFALDDCQVPHWKMRIQNGRSSLYEMLHEVLSMDPFESDERVLNVQHQFDWQGIQGNIEAVFKKDAKESDQALRAYENQKGIEIRMGLPKGRMSSGGTHDQSYAIDYGRKVLVKDVSVSASLDESWKLCFKAIPFLIENQKGERTFKLDPGVVLEVDGRKISIQEILRFNRPLKFTKASFQDPSCDLVSKRSGSISIENGSLMFRFD